MTDIRVGAAITEVARTLDPQARVGAAITEVARTLDPQVRVGAVIVEVLRAYSATPPSSALPTVVICTGRS